LQIQTQYHVAVFTGEVIEYYQNILDPVAWLSVQGSLISLCHLCINIKALQHLLII